MRVWIVGQHDDPEQQWQFQGVYSTRAKAEAACRTKDYFIAHVEMDEEMPHERSAWAPTEGWYPSEGPPIGAPT